MSAAILLQARARVGESKVVAADRPSRVKWSGMDRVAIEELYRRYGPLVLRRARSILGEESAARDAMQDVFVQAIRSADEFRGEASPVTWLYRITTNLCLNRLRDASRRRDLLALHASGGHDTFDAGPEQKIAIADLLRHVPDELREIAVYYHVDQMKQDEIADLIGVSRRTVGNRIEEFRVIVQRLSEETKRREAS